MGTPQRFKTEVKCRDGLSRSSDEVPVMGMEQRGKLYSIITFNNSQEDDFME
ncbi:hypothetical protein FHX64_000406 [Microbacter margulisiae]|uniref:Uncharacterized protein n=1 Tax=Microbacter margulisiae TaxID=1350067 RepID=A0A7W5H070_9PORP|nr:hypothetical protein [Microbacter margulisiae]